MAHPKKAHAIVFPYPYQGHLTPMINLSTELASRGFTITFIQIEFIHHSISKAHSVSPAVFDPFDQARKSGLDIRYTTISDGFPVQFDRNLNYDEYWHTMFLDFPGRVDQIVATLINADQQYCSSFFLIADTIFSWLATFIAKKYNLLNVSLWTEAATCFAINYHMDLLRDNGHFPYKGDDDFVIDYIPGVQSIRARDLTTNVRDWMPMVTHVVVKGFEKIKEVDFILFNAVQELESEAVSTLNQNQPIYAVGPVNFYTNPTKITSLSSETDCSRWLESKPPGSVLYVSFGSVAQTNKEAITEFANGLLLSEVYFIWVLRPGIIRGETQNDVLPTGFDDAIKERGLIVPWCNQDMVLSNPATGGFLTHCGWNSVLESMWYGVPMICYPFVVDQPTNRKLVVDDWKIGINLCEGEVRREEVVEKIKMVMKAQPSSEEIKNEMKKVSKKLHDSLHAQGSSRRNLDRFVEDLKTKLGSKDSY